MADLVVVSALPLRDDPCVPPPLGAAGGGGVVVGFFKSYSRRACGPVARAPDGCPEPIGLVGWWGCVRLFGSCPGGLGTEFIGIKKTCVFQFPVRDHLSEKVGQVFGVKLPCVEEGLGDALQIITVTGQGLARLGFGCPQGVLDPCPGLLREQSRGDIRRLPGQGVPEPEAHLGVGQEVGGHGKIALLPAAGAARDLFEHQRFSRASTEAGPDKGGDPVPCQEVRHGPFDHTAACPECRAFRGRRAEEMPGEEVACLMDGHPIQRGRVRRGGEIRCRGVEVAGREAGPTAACAGARGADKGRDLGAALPEEAIGEARQIRRGDGPGVGCARA